MAVIQIVDPADVTIAAGGDPTVASSNVDVNLATGSVAKTVTMWVMRPSTFNAFIGNSGFTPRATQIGQIPGGGAGAVSQAGQYSRTLTYDAGGIALKLGKFNAAAPITVAT